MTSKRENSSSERYTSDLGYSNRRVYKFESNSVREIYWATPNTINIIAFIFVANDKKPLSNKLTAFAKDETFYEESNYLSVN